MNKSNQRLHIRLAMLLSLVALFVASGQTCMPTDDGNGENDGNNSDIVCTELSDTSIDSDTTLVAGCYLANSSLSVSDGATLTLEPGVTLQFAAGTEMTVGNSSILVANGTADNPITLTGQEQTAGYWGGLRLYQSNSTSNVLDNVTIEYGGGYWDANLVVVGSSSTPSRVAVTQCTFSNSESYGLYCDENGTISTFSNNTVTANTLGAAWMDANTVGSLDDSSTFSGNTADEVRIWGSSVESDQTWPGINADYRLAGTLTVSADLTIEPGARLVFEAGQQMTVDPDGTLSAIGTETSPIELTGVEQTEGYWGGLRFYQSNSTSNALDHVTIEYGGGYWDANLLVTGSSSSPSRVDVTNCTLSGSETYGLYCDENGMLPAFSNNTITGNTTGAAYMAANVVGYLDSDSTYVGNDRDEVRIWGSSVEQDQTWPAIDGDYFISGTVTVGAHLTLEAGAQLVFDSGEQMTVDQCGVLTAVGTETEPIVFTGQEQTVGYWGGLRFYNSNSVDNDLEYVTIEYGGNYWDANLYLTGSSSEPTQISVTNCTIRYSGSNGIYLVSEHVTANADIATANTFTGNTGDDVYAP